MYYIAVSLFSLSENGSCLGETFWDIEQKIFRMAIKTALDAFKIEILPLG